MLQLGINDPQSGVPLLIWNRLGLWETLRWLYLNTAGLQSRFYSFFSIWRLINNWKRIGIRL